MTITRQTPYRQASCCLGDIHCDPQPGIKTYAELVASNKSVRGDAYVALAGGEITMIYPAANGGKITEKWAIVNER